MPVQLIYFAAEEIAALENKLSQLGKLKIRKGENRREFLTELSQAVGESKIILAVGEAQALISTLSRGLGLPLEEVDWSQFGINGISGAALPKGALPLTLDRSVCGMILESGEQCIIALDSRDEVVDMLYDTYVEPYLQAISAPEQESAAYEPEAEKIEDAADEPVTETVEAIVEAEPTAEPEAEAEPQPEQIAPVKRINSTKTEYDIFAGTEAENVDLIFEKPKKKGRAWIVVLCILLSLLIAGGAGWFFLLRDGIGDDYYAELMKSYGETGSADKLPDEFNNLYLTRFGALYLQNSDVVGTVTLPFAKEALPIVCSANKGTDYYAMRRFDGQFALYGTPYTNFAYDENSSNPNLVVYGGSMFAELSRLLDKNAGNGFTILTDSILYGEDEWEVFAVLQPETLEGAKFTSNFSSMNAPARASIVKAVLSQSKVDLGFTAEDFDDIGLESNFLTLIGTDKGKTVAVMARRISNISFDVEEPIEEPTEDTNDNTNEDTSSENNNEEE